VLALDGACCAQTAKSRGPKGDHVPRLSIRPSLLSVPRCGQLSGGVWEGGCGCSRFARGTPAGSSAGGCSGWKGVPGCGRRCREYLSAHAAGLHSSLRRRRQWPRCERPMALAHVTRLSRDQGAEASRRSSSWSGAPPIHRGDAWEYVAARCHAASGPAYTLTCRQRSLTRA
jgi:hypothetical protein